MLSTIENIRQIRDISQNLRDGRIQPYIKEVEDIYIVPAIGAELYEKLDSGEVTDQILLEGGYYDRKTEEGKTSRDRCYGLRLATAYFAYARVLRNNQVNVTAFGVTQKHGLQSEANDEKNIADAVSDAKKMGEHYLNSCIRYLKREEKPCCCKKEKSEGIKGNKLRMEVIL